MKTPPSQDNAVLFLQCDEHISEEQILHVSNPITHCPRNKFAMVA